MATDRPSFPVLVLGERPRGVFGFPEASRLGACVQGGVPPDVAVGDAIIDSGGVVWRIMGCDGIGFGSSWFGRLEQWAMRRRIARFVLKNVDVI